MKISKEEFDKLYDENITKKEYDRIIEKINVRFSEIMTTLKPALKKKGWFDYGNCDYYSEESGGYFDPQVFKTDISVGGEHSNLKDPFSYCIPTRWLWEPFKAEYNREVKAFEAEEEKRKAKAKERRQERKAEKDKLIKSIKSKLTAEELRVIKFKK